MAGAPAIYWVVLSAAAAAGFWTVPSILYAYLSVLLWMLWQGGLAVLRPMIIAGTITALVVIFLYMPVITVSGPAALFANPVVLPQPLPEFRADAMRFPKRLLTLVHGGDPMFF